MELARRLVESQKMPICIINGAVGGTRIDQHQRNPADPTDVTTIYGRLLWRVQQAKLTHGIRGVLWHQGENDQGADGPTGGYGWETYRQYFIDLAAAWKQDYPNIQHYYVFQIWPKACCDGHQRLRQPAARSAANAAELFSNLSVMSTLGIKPPGGCHFPARRLRRVRPADRPLDRVPDQYHQHVDEPVSPPNLQRAYFATATNVTNVVLEFDQHVVWSDALTRASSISMARPSRSPRAPPMATNSCLS